MRLPPSKQTVTGSILTPAIFLCGDLHGHEKYSTTPAIFFCGDLHGHEKYSTTIVSLPLIQEGQLSVTGERMCTKYW